MTNIVEVKDALRDRVWRLLEREGAVPEGSYGTIPGFRGTEATAERLAELDVWKRASTVTPDDVVECTGRRQAGEDCGCPRAGSTAAQ